MGAVASSQSHLISSWRPIAVLNTFYRLFALVINNRLLDWATRGSLISPTQNDLLSSDGCSEHNAYLLILKEHAKRNLIDLNICWFDLADAFPSVPLYLINFTLEKMGLRIETINLINSVYRNVNTFYKCNDLITLAIPINRGVRQVCPISMTIFCLTIDFVLRHFKDHPGNLIVNNQQFTLLAYADDLVLLGSSNQDIESKVNELVSIVDKIHLKFKQAKCGYFTLNGLADIRIYGEKFPLLTKIILIHIWEFLLVPQKGIHNRRYLKQ